LFCQLKGENFYRWDDDKGTQHLQGFGYNMYWPPLQVNYLLKMMPDMLEKYNLKGTNTTFIAIN
jgi:hypothetical protein